jgi:hypothetical protein
VGDNGLNGVHTNAGVNERGDSTFTLRSGSKDFPVVADFYLFNQLPIPPKSKNIKIECSGAFLLYNSEDSKWYNKDWDDIWLTLTQLNGTRTVRQDSLRLISVKHNDSIPDGPEMETNVLTTEVDKRATQMSINIIYPPTLIFELQSCDIMVDDRDIRRYKFDNGLTISQKKQKAFRRSISDSLNLPPVKLLAIGESLHGVKEFYTNRLDVIKQQVNRGVCKLIMAELPVIEGLEINQYIHGNRDMEHIHSIFGTFMSEEFEATLTFLRDYESQIG